MSYFIPDWQIPRAVRALTTDRLNGFSEGVFGSFNLGTHVGDNPVQVHKNRAILPTPAEPAWLEQVHGNKVLRLPLERDAVNKADASFSTVSHQVAVVMTADCLPVLLCNQDGDFVAAIHCGWRGLAAGILQASVAKFEDNPEKLLAWLGPAISKQVFEVGNDVVSAFPSLNSAFTEKSDGKYLADIKYIASQQLNDLGVSKITIHPDCTYLTSEKYFSYRRDGQTGRMASLIWFE